MARRRKSKIQPAVQTMTFQFSVDAGQELNFIDLSQCASILNRRFYRQGLNWAVGGFKVLTTSEGQIQIQKLPNTWVMSNAWEKSFRAWQQMIKNATEESGSESIKGKFLDFKIYASNDHHRDGYGANLLPNDSLNNIAVPGQWQPATIEMPQTAVPGTTIEYELIAVGPNNPGPGASGLNAKSLIAGYANSRALPYEQDPNTPDDAADYTENWMLGLFSEGNLQDQDVVDMLNDTGDQAPYPYEGDGTNPDTMYPGGETQLAGLEVHSGELITSTTVGGTTRFKGGNFPCGLITIGTSMSDAASIYLEIDLVPGMHRGYLCESMTEM